MNNWQLIVLSARTKDALHRSIDNFAQFFREEKSTNLADAAYTLQIGRKPFKHRLSIVSDSLSDAGEKLLSFDAKEKVSVVKRENRPVIFMFTGSGSQYMNMASEMYREVKLFQELIHECFEHLPSDMSETVKETLFPGDDRGGKIPQESEVAPYITFIVEYALAKYLLKSGIKPYAMIGDQIGEYVVGCLSGVFGLHDAIQIISAQGNLAEVKKLDLKTPRIPYISHLTGDWITVEEAVNPNYWVEQTRQRVDFSEGLTKLLENEDGIFIEFGGDALSAIARQHAGRKEEQLFMNLLPAYGDDTPDHCYFLEKLGMLWSVGLQLDWEVLHQEKRCRLPLPTYSFGQQKFVSDINLLAFQQGFSGGGNAGRPALFERAGEIENYVAPRNEKEEKIIEVYQEVIGLNKISINEDFFELGGDSLKAIQLVGELHKAFNVEVKVSEIFQFPTAAELAEYIAQISESTYTPIPRVEEREYYPVAAAQMRVFALNQFDLKSTVYNLPTAYIISGEIDLARLQSAVDQVIDRHESLRTSFHLVDGVPMQKIHDKAEIDFKIGYKEHGITKVEEIKGLVQEFVKPFAFDKPPLMRTEVVKIGLEKYMLFVDMHHIISDGTSMENLVRDLMIAYQGETLSPLRLQYKDFAVWQNEWMDSERVQNQKKYWLDRFSGEIPTLEIQTDYPRPAHQSFNGDRFFFNIDKDKMNRLKALSSKQETTVFMVLLAAYNVLLAKYSRQSEIIVGVPTTGRNHPDLKEHVGMFVNTLPMANYPESTKTFRQFLLEVKQNTLDAFENQDYQFDALVKDLNLRRDLSRNPVFNTMFTFQNMEETKLVVEDLQFKAVDIKDDTSQFDVSLEIRESDNKMICNFEYCVELFKLSKIQKMSEHFNNILEEIINNPNISLGEIDLLSQSEKETLIYDFNRTTAEYQKDQTLHGLFEEQVAKTPAKLAAIFRDQKLTYLELNQRANQLARVLRGKGIKEDSIVAIMADRSLEMLVGIFGILKAGGAYLPIDPEYPTNRIEYMLEDSKVDVILTQKHLLDRVNFKQEMMDLNDPALYQGNDTCNLVSLSTPQNLAYLIYTSGSTGKPKGVMLEHQSVVNYISWAQKVYLQGDACDFPLYSSLSFDLTVTSIYTPLFSGNTIIVYDQDDNLLITKIVQDNQVDVVKLTPSHLKAIEELDLSQSRIKRLIVGGEALKSELARKIHQKFNGNVEIYNEYGPTEATVGCMIYRFDPADDSITVPIGVPADNVQIYLFDENLHPVGVGVPAEMYISGDGLARGYMNKPELTRERFIDNPFREGQKMYKTGDLAMFLSDGNIEFLGRIDHQVKIRGFRIETGEIESELSKYPGMKEVVVTDREAEDKSRFLVAYFVSEAEISADTLREYLKDKLPQYMIPTFFVRIDLIPLTPNGKVDKKALPELEIGVEEEYIAPRTELERKLAAVWEEVLHVGQIGVNYDFFKIGGESLKAISIVSKLMNQGMELGVNDLFNYPTIRELAGVLETRAKSALIGEVDKLEEALCNESNSRVKLIKYVTDKNSYKVMYLEDPAAISALQEFIAGYASEELYPNYVQPISLIPDEYLDKQEVVICEEQLAQLVNLSSCDKEAEAEKIVNVINQHNTLLNNMIRSNQSVYQFPVSPVQKRHILSSKNRASGNIVRINRFIDQAKFEKAFLKLVQEEELLRAILATDNGQFAWKIHDLPAALSIPVIDLSNYREAEKEELFKIIVKDQFSKEYRPDEIFYRAFLITWDLTTHYFAIPIDHAIFDRMSMRVIEDKLVNYYDHIADESALVSSAKALYSDYIKQITIVPDSDMIQEVVATYDLENYSHYKEIVEEFILKNETDVVEVRDVVLPFDDQITPEKSWQLSFYLFTKALAEYLGTSKVPIKLVNFGRRYQDTTYYNTVGEFLDFIPILVDTDESNPAKMVKSVQNKLKYAEKNIINFVNLLDQEKAIDTLVMPQKLGHLDIIFNFEDFMSTEENKISRLFMSQSDHVIAEGFQVSSIECAVFYDADKLTISIVSPLADCVSSLVESIKELANSVKD